MHAVQELQQGFEIDAGLRNRYGLSLVTPALVDVLCALGRSTEARAYCQRALQIAPRDKRLLRIQARLDHARALEGTIKCILYQREHHYHYGFIAPDDGGDDIYFREGFIPQELVAQFAPGTRVQVTVEQTTKGPRALQIEIITET